MHCLHNCNRKIFCNFNDYRISLNAVSLRDDTTRVSWAWSQKAPTWGLPTRWLVPRVWFARYWHQQSRAQSLAVKIGWRYTSVRNKGLAFIVWSFFQVKITYSALFVKILLWRFYWNFWSNFSAWLHLTVGSSPCFWVFCDKMHRIWWSPFDAFSPELKTDETSKRNFSREVLSFTKGKVRS